MSTVPPESLEAIFFDAGFTLIEPKEDVATTYWRLARAVGAITPFDELQRHLRRLWKTLATAYRSSDEGLASSEAMERRAWAAFTADVARPFPDLVARHAEWHQRLVEHFDHPGSWRLLDDAPDVLQACRQRGWRLGILSNWHSALHGILEGLGIKERFDVILTSAEAGRKKPHRHLFERGLAALGCHGGNAVHVGDSWRDDVEGARGVGIRPVYLARESDTDHHAEDVVRIRSLKELVPRLEAMV